MKIDEIIVKDRIRKDTGGMMELINDIKANGLINPVTINTDHVLLAGYRRLTACKALGMEDIPVHMVSTESEEQDLKIEISENENRKEFTMTERLDYARRLQRIESIKAEQRKQSGQFGSDPQNSAEPSEKGESRDKVAEQVKMSHDTLRKAQVIAENKEKFNPEEFKNWDDGKLSTNKLYTQLKQKLEESETKANKLQKAYKEMNDAYQGAKKELIEQQNKPPVVQTVEKLVTPDDYEFLKKDNIRLSEERKQYLEEARKWEQKYKESGKIAPTLDQKATKDINWLTMGIMEFLRSYGGKAWGIYRKSEIWKNSTDELKEQSKNLLAFAQNLYSIVTDGAEEKR